MTLLESFCQLRNVAESAGEVNYGERKLTGQIELNAETRSALQVLSDAGNLPSLAVSGRLTTADRLPPSGRASFEADAPKGYFENLPELIRRHPCEPPADLWIFDLNDATVGLPKYRDAVCLAELLTAVSVNHGKTGWTLWSKNRLEIPLKYAVSDLCLINEVREMREKLIDGQEMDAQAKRILDVYRSIFVQAISEVLVGVPSGNRFSHLMGHFSECLFRFRLGFQSFSDEANHAIKRYEESRAGMITALNGVLGNIQTALIGVPLAGLLALKEMKPTDGITYENGIIAAAVFIVGMLLLTLSVSQGKTLNAIEGQHTRLSKEIADCGGSGSKTGKLLSEMVTHHSFVSKLLIAVRIIIAIFMGVALFALLFRTRGVV